MRSHHAARAGIGAPGLITLSLAIFSIGPALAEPLTLDVTQAAPSLDRLDPSHAVLIIRLTDNSRQAFADFSKAHVDQKIDVRIDGKSVMKPMLREPITGGVININALNFDETQSLAVRLSSKAAKLEVEVAQ